MFGVEGLAFSFNDPDQDGTQGYSFYSYGSDKNQFINFAQLMMREFQDKKSGFEKVCHGLLQVLLVYIARKQNLSVISDSSFRLSKECALAKRYIDINYSQNITLDSLAEITHINKFYLAHSFTECIGQSPINYLTNRRLEASKELLTSSNLSVTQVASSVGFSSQSYFSQNFQKKVGMSPRQYRKLHSK
ncbi:araC-type DNA-binding domain-containing proteins [Firmicutes bacterium CAG:227]|nr:araC-type DNA-binding domain-containing proteins [Firmicutes bacterium CAG:227]